MDTASEIDFRVPASWADMTEDQLRVALLLLSRNMTCDELRLRALLAFSDTRVAGPGSSPGCYILARGRYFFEVSSGGLAELLPALDYVLAPPDMPVRLPEICGAKAVDPLFFGVDFATYLACENLYLGYLQTRDPNLLDQTLPLLYPGLGKEKGRGRRGKGEDGEFYRTCAFWWLTSLRRWLGRKYPDLLRPASEPQDGNLLGAAPVSPEESTNAQLRALTGGDPTKEEAVLSLDTHRALSELNAQAREHHQLNQRLANARK